MKLCNEIIQHSPTMLYHLAGLLALLHFFAILLFVISVISVCFFHSCWYIEISLEMLHMHNTFSCINQTKWSTDVFAENNGKLKIIHIILYADVAVLNNHVDILRQRVVDLYNRQYDKLLFNLINKLVKFS